MTSPNRHAPGALCWLPALIVCALAAGVAARPLVHDDIFWHLRAGELIVETGSIPHSDSWSHTRHGERWVTHEWGFELLVYAVHRLGGLHGLIVAKQLIAGLLFLAIFASARRIVASARAHLAIPLLLIGVGIGQVSSFAMRAAFLSTLLLAVLLWLLLALRQAHGRRRNVLRAAVLLLVLIWSNMHTGVVFGLGVLGMFWLDAVVENVLATVPARAAPIASRAGEMAVLLLAGVALSLANPNGLDLWLYPIRLNQLFYGGALDWGYMGIFAAPRPGRHPWLFVLLTLVLLSCLPLRKSLEQLRSTETPARALALGTLFFGAMALRSNRFVLDFVVFAVPFCLQRARYASARLPGEPFERFERFAPWGWSAVAATGLVLSAAPLPQDPIAPGYPRRAASFLVEQGIRGRLLNPQVYGGYLGYATRQPVFWDGRNLLFGPTAVQWAYAEDFGAILQRHPVDVMVLDLPIYQRAQDYLSGSRDAWGLVYMDGRFCIYLARTDANAPLLARLELRLLQPFAWPAPDALDDATVRARVRAELARVLETAGEVPHALYGLALVARVEGDPARALSLMERSARALPRGETYFEAAQLARQLGDEARAEALARRALELAR